MQLNQEKATFGRHETFPLRCGWLPKGAEALEQTPRIFSQPEQAMINLGVGRNTGNAIQYWLQAAGQVEIDSVCIGMSDGRKHFIVTEAKRGPFDSIAKHEQAYPGRPTGPSAVPSNILDDIPIIAV